MKKVVIALLLILAIERFCYKKTAGFRTQKIEGALAVDARWQTSSHLTEAQIDEILSQPFYFLGSGAQSFAFESADHKTVLKFMKQNRRKPLPWLEALPLPPLLSDFRSAYLQKRKKRLEDVLSSAKIACNQLSQQTGVLFAHLNTTPDIQKTVTLYDKIGVKHSVNLASTLFVLQKRGTILMDKPLDENTIAGMIRHVKLSCEKGIAHLDPIVERNFGVYENSVFTIDFGSLKYDPKLKTFPYLQRELFYELLTLRQYLKKNNPELLGCFDETMQKELVPSP